MNTALRDALKELRLSGLAESLEVRCHRALENQPVVGASKPARGFRVVVPHLGALAGFRSRESASEPVGALAGSGLQVAARMYLATVWRSTTSSLAIRRLDHFC